MRRLPILLGTVAMVALSVAAETAPEVKIEEAPLTWKQAALADGQGLYIEICAVCHGTDATGNGPAAPALSSPVPDLTRLALHDGGVFDSAEVQKTIRGQVTIPAHGTSQMPVWGRAFEDVRLDYKPARRRAFAQLRILALTEYLESIQIAAAQSE